MQSLMDKEQAIQTIEQAIDVAVQKGIYSLKDMVFILDALKMLKEE
jgi:hypothetical protein